MKRALLGSILLHVLLLGALAAGFRSPPATPPFQLLLQAAPQAAHAPTPPAVKAATNPPANPRTAPPVRPTAQTLAAKPGPVAPSSPPPLAAEPVVTAVAAPAHTPPAPLTEGGGQTDKQGSGQLTGSAAEKTGSSKEVRVRLAPKPDYPALSRELDEEGTVWLLVDVDEAGMPVRIQLRRSSGFVRLDRAAKLGVAAWRFDPAQQGGQAQPSRIELPVRFSLKEQ